MCVGIALVSDFILLDSLMIFMGIIFKLPKRWIWRIFMIGGYAEWQ